MAQKQVATIPHVLKTMVVAEEKSPKTESRLTDINGKIKKLKGFRVSDVFGFEKEQTPKAITQLEKEKFHLEMALLGFREMDYSFLGWRNKITRLPAFMILDLESNEFSLAVEAYEDEDDDVEFEPQLPDAIEDQFEDVIQYLGTKSRKTRGWNAVQISAEFQGVMSPEVREKTKAASRHFDEVFLIAEAPAWKIDEIRSTKGDPLVVGWVEETEQMFLITAFDPTDLEKYVQEQHTF